MIEFISLGMVLHEPLTGYDIKKRIEAGIGNFYKVSYGNLYPALKKLTDKGNLTMDEQKQGNRQKKYYRATESGRAAFLEWLSSPLATNNEDTHMLKIFLLGELPKENRIVLLEEYEFYLRQMLRQLQNTEKQLPAEELNDKDYFEISTFYFSYQLLQNTIRWLRYIREQKPLSKFLSESKDCEEADK
jgi:DNA-binding PadR family transcriptional regulator